MVKIVKSMDVFPNGLPGIKVSYPLWEGIELQDPQNKKGIFRGDFLFFDYKSRVEKEKKINSNPLVMFEGLDRNGNILGSNLMFFNTFIDPKTGQKTIQRRKSLPVFDISKKLHWDDLYDKGERKSFKACERSNYYRVFGRTTGEYLTQFWRVYDRRKIENMQCLHVDSALSILSMTPPKFVKSTLYIE